MGSDRTPSANTGQLGILVPYPMDETHLTGTLGTDYTEADPEIGRFESDDTTVAYAFEGLGAIPSGDGPLSLRVVQGGPPSPRGRSAQVAYRVSDTGLWRGQDPPVYPLGQQQVDVTGGTGIHLVAMPNGQCAGVWLESVVNIRIRDTDGEWGSTPSQFDDLTTTANALIVAPDGTLHLYGFAPDPNDADAATLSGLRLYRSTDNGSTWTLQSYNVLDATVTTSQVRVLRMEVDASGAVVAFITLNSGTSSGTYQFASGDLGYRFRQITSSAASRTTVWDVRRFGGVTYVLSVEQDTTDRLYIRRLGSVFVNFANTPAVEIVSASDHDVAASMVAHPTGRIFVYLERTTGNLQVHASDDQGETFSLAGVYSYTFATDQPGGFSTVWNQGQVIMLANETGNGGASAGSVHEIRWGRHTSFTLAPSSVYLANTYLPVDTLDAVGWTNAGTATRTLSADTGMRIQTAGATAENEESASETGPGIFGAVIEVDSGTGSLVFECDGVRVQIDVTSTQHRWYDETGSASTYADHGYTGAIEYWVIIDDTNARAYCWFRAHDNEPEQDFSTALGSLTSLGAVTAGTHSHKIEVATSSDVYVKAAWYGRLVSAGAVGTDGITTPDELNGVPLTESHQFLTSGVAARIGAGVLRVDGSTHAASNTSAYRLANILPRVARSPNMPWRSGQTDQDEVIDLNIPGGDAAPLLGLWFQNVEGVYAPEIAVTGGPTYTPEIRMDLSYDTVGDRTVIPRASSTDADGAWYPADALKGWHMECDDGTIVKVAGNTEGSFCVGSTIDTKRIRIFLEDDHDSASAGDGYLYPDRFLVLIATTAAQSTLGLSITIPSTDYVPPSGYRQIGVLAVGPVQILPIGADLNDGLTIESNANTQEAPDGRRYSVRHSEDRERWTLSWVGSIHDVYQTSGSGVTSPDGWEVDPDYVTAYTSGPPAATFGAVSEVLRGIFTRSRGLPVVAVHDIPVQGSAGGFVRWVDARGGIVYGPISGAYRREAVQYIGQRGRSQVYRIPAFTLEEEL